MNKYVNGGKTEIVDEKKDYDYLAAIEDRLNKESWNTVIYNKAIYANKKHTQAKFGLIDHRPQERFALEKVLLFEVGFKDRNLDARIVLKECEEDYMILKGEKLDLVFEFLNNMILDLCM